MLSKVCVTGGAGFIGSHLVQKLAFMGCDITVIDDFSSGEWHNLNHASVKVRIFSTSINHPEYTKLALTDCEVVFHLASLVSVPDSIENPKEYRKVIVDGTKRVRDDAPPNAKVIMSSSCAVYGNADCHPKPVSEECPTNPLSPYAEYKLEAESEVDYSLRLFNVYGPRQRFDSPYSGVVAKFNDCKKHCTTPTIYGDGQQTRDFVSVHDVVDVMIECARGNDTCARGKYNIGSGTETSILELSNYLCGDTSPVFMPAREEINKIYADTTKAKNELNFFPKVELKDGLQEL